MVKSSLPVTQALFESLLGRWKPSHFKRQKWEKSSPCEEQSTQNISAASQGTGNTCEQAGSWSVAQALLRWLLPASQSSGTIRVLKSYGKFVRVCRGEFYPCCTQKVKSEARFYPEGFLDHPYLAHITVQRGRGTWPLAHRLNKLTSYMVMLCCSQHKSNQVSLREAFPGLFAPQRSQLLKAKPQNNPHQE